MKAHRISLSFSRINQPSKVVFHGLSFELPTKGFVVIIGFDFVIKTMISSNFFIDIPYRFPIEAILVLSSIFFIFYSIMVTFQNTIIDRLVEKK
jgi:hypothetical protein